MKINLGIRSYSSKTLLAVRNVLVDNIAYAGVISPV
jgi:hypothetical protein